MHDNLRGAILLSVSLSVAITATASVSASGSASSRATACTSNGPIAFITDDAATGISDIATVSPRGRGLVRLTDTGDAWSPSWSPDGTKIVYEDHVDGDGDIYVMDRDGGNVVNLTETSEADEASPEWSPNGRWIVFTSDRAHHDRSLFDIYKMRPNGNRVQRLTRNRVQDWTPTWSPNSRRIAFVRITNVEHIFVMRADGSRVRNVTGEDDGANPDWSPNGKRIAYQSLNSDGGEVDVYTIRPDGSRMRRLTRGGGNEQNPSWSPSGRRIAFAKSWQLYKMRSDGSRVRRIPAGDGDVYAPAWGPRPC